MREVLRPEAGRPSIPLGVYFRMLLIGYFDVESRGGVRIRLALREFLGITLEENPPDHSSVSRTWRGWIWRLTRKCFQ